MTIILHDDDNPRLVDEYDIKCSLEDENRFRDAVNEAMNNDELLQALRDLDKACGDPEVYNALESAENMSMPMIEFSEMEVMHANVVKALEQKPPMGWLDKAMDKTIAERTAKQEPDPAESCIDENGHYRIPPRTVAQLVYCMDFLMHHLNDESASEWWLMEGCPDGLYQNSPLPPAGEYEDLELTPDEFEDYVRIFSRIVARQTMPKLPGMKKVTHQKGAFA